MKIFKQAVSVLLCLVMAISSPLILSETVSAANVNTVSTGASSLFGYNDIPLASESDFSVFDYENGVAVEWYLGNATKIRIPDTIGGKKVVAITNDCFSEKQNITHIILPDTLIYAEPYSFNNCSDLEVIHLGSLQKPLSGYEFSWLLHGCNKLKKMSMSDSANFPLDYDWGCFGDMFYDEVRNNLEYIYIGKSMSNVAIELFYGENLKWAEIGNGNSLYSSVNGIVYDSDKTTLMICPTAYEKSEYKIPSGVKTIASSAFQFCTNIKKLTIPKSVTTIKNSFYSCKDLTIIGATNSAAHKFAKENGIKFSDPDYVAEKGIAISKTSATLSKGSNLRLTASVNPSNATNNGITWSSSDSSLVVVNSKGYVTAKSAGTAIVTAKSSNGKTATCKITVKNVTAASNGLIPDPYLNLNYAKISDSYLASTTTGYMRVFYDGNKVCIEYYDDLFNLVSTKSINMELDIWGGFYAGSNAYYIVEGKNNQECIDNSEVVRIIKYDKNWKRLGAGKIYAKEGWDYEIRYPFDYSNVNMHEYNGYLYVVTGREGYVDPRYGQGHQGMMLIRVNTSNMNAEVLFGDFWHSFQQYIDRYSSDLYILEQSEGSRYTSLSKYDTKTDNYTTIPVFRYGGIATSAWAIPCYATVNDMAVSSTNILGIGTSIDQSKYDSYDYNTPYNIYLTVTPRNNFTEKATKNIWLTNYVEDKDFMDVKLTKVNNNRFLVTWRESSENVNTKKLDVNDPLSEYVLHYLFIDANGKKLTKEFTATAAASRCKPIIDGSKIIFYASSENSVTFYTINANTGALTKKVHRVAGDNATWAINNNELTVSGKGAITSGFTDSFPFYGYYTDSTNNKITKLTIKSGITTISKSSFEDFDDLKTVTIENGLKKIESRAFAYCYDLESVIIPSSVTNISNDTFPNWWNSLKIYGNKGSYAEKFAKNNSYEFSSLDSAPPVSVKLNKSSFSLAVGKSATLTASVSPSYTKNKTVTWTSSNTKIATVSKGKITAKSAGVVTITVKTSNGKTAKCKVTITTATPAISKVENKSNGIKVTWGKVTGAVMYRVYRKSGTGSWAKVGDTTSTTFTDKTAKSGTKYTYTVRTITKDGKVFTSGYNKTGKSVNYIASPVISQLANTKSNIKITWSKSKGATAYKVYRKASGDKNWTAIGTVKGVNNVTFTDKTAKKGITYTYTIKAYNSKVQSASNSGKSIRRLTNPAVKSAANMTKGIKITWGKVTGASGYYIYRKANNAKSWSYTGTTKGNSAATFTDTKVKSGVKYTYTVRAYYGSSKSSFDSTVKTTRLSTPVIKSVSNTTPGIKITWAKVTGAGGYYVYRKASNASKWTYIGKAKGVNTLSFVDKKTTNGVTYIYTVAAYGSAVKSASSVSNNIKRLSTPTLKSTANATSGIKLTWGKVTGAKGYQVYRKAGNAKTWILVANIKSGSTVTYLDKNVKEGVKYTYTVRAYNGSFKSSFNSGISRKR